MALVPPRNDQRRKHKRDMTTKVESGQQLEDVRIIRREDSEVDVKTCRSVSVGRDVHDGAKPCALPESAGGNTVKLVE